MEKIIYVLGMLVLVFLVGCKEEVKGDIRDLYTSPNESIYAITTITPQYDIHINCKWIINNTDTLDFEFSEEVISLCRKAFPDLVNKINEIEKEHDVGIGTTTYDKEIFVVNIITKD